jgi:hypothetical protein
LKDAFRALVCIYLYNTSTFAHWVRYLLNLILVSAALFAGTTALVEVFSLKSPDLEGVVYLACLEGTTLLAFILHLFITWQRRTDGLTDFFRMAVLYQLFGLIPILLRYGLFFLFSLQGMNYTLNILLGIGLYFIVNLFGFEQAVLRNVFKRKPAVVAWK